MVAVDYPDAAMDLLYRALGFRNDYLVASNSSKVGGA
jgi:hypothetical protein